MQAEPGRRIPDPGFAGDTGAPDPALAAALAAAGSDDGRLPEVLAALHGARVLAPVVAVLAESAVTGSGLVVDKRADIAVPLLVSADGARAVPVFTGLEALARWDPAARPVPVTGPRAAEVALAEAAEALLVDLAGPHPATLGAAELHALATGRGLVPAYADEALRVAVHRVLAGVPEVAAGWLSPWPGSDARLTVALADGAVPAAVAPRLVAALPEPLRSGGVRGVDLAVLGPGEPPPAGRRVFTRSGHRGASQVTT